MYVSVCEELKRERFEQACEQQQQQQQQQRLEDKGRSYARILKEISRRTDAYMCVVTHVW